MKDPNVGADVLEWLGDAYKVILPTAGTGGFMSIIDCLALLGSSTPRHIHEREDETFVVLTGQCEFWLEGETFTRGPGETAFIPRGKNHALRVIGHEPSRHLVILTPGGFEGFFADMAKGQFRIPEDMDKIGASAAVHGCQITGPPLGAE